MSKKDGKQNNKRKAALKSVLCTPYNVQWPKLDATTQQGILKHMQHVLTNHNLKKTSFKKHLKKDERKVAIQKILQTRTTEEKNLKSQIVCGVNEVTKCLEKDCLRLILVDKSAYILTKHLLQLAGVRNCMAVALSDLRQSIAPLLSMTQLSSIGIRKLKSGDDKSFNELVNFVEEKCPKIELPWLNFEQSLTEFPESDSESESEEILANREIIISEHVHSSTDESVNDDKSNKEKDVVKEIAVTDQLVSKELVTKIKNELGSDFVAFVNESSSGEDCNVSIKPVVESAFLLDKQPFGNKHKRKLTSDDLKNKRKKFDESKSLHNDSSNESSNYKSISLHKMQANLNKTKKKKKKNKNKK